MREELRAAIESARSVHTPMRVVHFAEPQRQRSRQSVRALVLAVVRELPDDMTAAEIREELEIASNQHS
jgi:hypothetical protein